MNQEKRHYLSLHVQVDVMVQELNSTFLALHPLQDSFHPTDFIKFFIAVTRGPSIHSNRELCFSCKCSIAFMSDLMSLQKSSSFTATASPVSSFCFFLLCRVEISELSTPLMVLACRNDLANKTA
mmetsp:Transcript_3885/g.5990  ORF Transcript_3885/g.5990 Transcript_3885/m.5990 type:complete len:125 (-) Transcript_3885:783-1157(-)